MSIISSFRLPQAGERVRVIKQSACANPVTLPASWDDWVLGGWENQGGLPVDYEIEGILFEPIEVGRRLCVLRDVRNGVRAEGSFLSTPVVTVEEPDRVTTRNSVYFVSAL